MKVGGKLLAARGRSRRDSCVPATANATVHGEGHGRRRAPGAADRGRAARACATWTSTSCVNADKGT